MGWLDEYFIGSLFQCLHLLIREGSIASLCEIMVEGSVGVLWRADGHNRKVKVVNWVGADRGGNRRFLPLVIRLADQDTSSDEPKTDNHQPQKLSWSGLKRMSNDVRHKSLASLF